MEEKVMDIININGRTEDRLLAILLAIQEASENNFVAIQWAKCVAKELTIPLTKVNDVLTFYSMFSTKPRGKYVIEICKSTPCRITKSDLVAQEFAKELHIKVGQTTSDMSFTLMYTECVGSCEIGPVAKIGEAVYGNLTSKKITDIINSYREVIPCQ